MKLIILLAVIIGIISCNHRLTTDINSSKHNCSKTDSLWHSDTIIYTNQNFATLKKNWDWGSMIERDTLRSEIVIYNNSDTVLSVNTSYTYNDLIPCPHPFLKIGKKEYGKINMLLVPIHRSGVIQRTFSLNDGRYYFYITYKGIVR